MLKQSTDVADGRVGIGELPRGLLRVDAPPIHADLEHPPGRGDELQGAEAELELQDFGRQTDGVGFIVSSGAVFDDDFRFHAFGRANLAGSVR